MNIDCELGCDTFQMKMERYSKQEVPENKTSKVKDGVWSFPWPMILRFIFYRIVD
jgi:hypothetical protein